MVLKHTRPLSTPEEAMHVLLEEETTASITKELGDASMWAAHFSQVATTGAEANALGKGVVDAEDAVDAVNAVNTVETVDPETVTKVSSPIATLTAILQMHAESANACRREETMEMMSAFASSAGSKATSKSIASPTNV